METYLLKSGFNICFLAMEWEAEVYFFMTLKYVVSLYFFLLTSSNLPGALVYDFTLFWPPNMAPLYSSRSEMKFFQVMIKQTYPFQIQELVKSCLFPNGRFVSIMKILLHIVRFQGDIIVFQKISGTLQ